MQVTVYTTSTCPWCRAAKQYLDQHQVPYQEVNVEQNPRSAYEMVRRSGQQGVPVITVDDEVIVGFDRDRLERVLAAARNGKPVFGAAVADAARHLAKLGQVPVFGAYIGKVSPGSPAHRAGLQPGDIITQINVRPINNAADVEQALAAVKRGDFVDVTFLREGRQATTKARL